MSFPDPPDSNETTSLFKHIANINTESIWIFTGGRP